MERPGVNRIRCGVWFSDERTREEAGECGRGMTCVTCEMRDGVPVRKGVMQWDE